MFGAAWVWPGYVAHFYVWGIWSPHKSLVIVSNESDLFLVGYWTSPRLPFVSHCVFNDVHAVLMLMRKLSVNMKLKFEDFFNPTEMSSVEEAKSGARRLKINVSMTALDGGVFVVGKRYRENMLLNHIIKMFFAGLTDSTLWVYIFMIIEACLCA